jgi:conjugative relaxase-like TrwC/TraI family protein
MARQGHCDSFPHGSLLAAQVGYRLGGVTPNRSLSQADQERQIDYRLGAGAVDSRQVWFLGSGGTASLLGYRPGERVTPEDAQVVRDAMFGMDRLTGERIPLHEVGNPVARVAARPVAEMLQVAMSAARASAEECFSSRDAWARWKAVERSGARSNGTVVFATAAGLLRSNELAWRNYENACASNRTKVQQAAVKPAFRINRAEVMERLGAHHRALHEGGQPQDFGGKSIDTSLSDLDLGTWIWAQVEAESRRKVVKENAGYEFTLTCPKSFSVAALLDAPDRREEWLDTMREAVTGAMDELMRRVAHGRTGHNGEGPAIRGDGYAATVSIESHSRELDPHLHGHVMIPNRLLCADGKDRGMGFGGSDFINHAWLVQAEFERRLRRLSVERGLVPGWEMDLANQQWEVAGADRDMMEFFSQGHALVRAAVAEAVEGEGGRATRARMRQIDSRAKRQVTGRKGDEQLTWAQIRDRMQTRADAAGIDLTAVFNGPSPDPNVQPNAWSRAAWALVVDQTVCETKSHAITARVEACVRAIAPHEWDDDQIRDTVRGVIADAFTTGETKARGSVGVRKHASDRILDAELRAWSAFTDGYHSNPHRLDSDTVAAGLEQWKAAAGWTAAGREFTPGQRALFEQMTSGRDRVSLVVGAAGSGKTTAIDAARHVLAAHGQQVYGVSVAAIAAQGLKHAARIQSGTVAYLVNRIEFATNPIHPIRRNLDALDASPSRADQARAASIRTRFALPDMDHLVIDEASMIAATDLATVLEWTRDQGITVTLVGDDKQLSAVGPSGLFPRLQHARPGAELTENLRQRTDVGRECAAFLRDGDTEAALTLLADAGQLIVVASQAEAEHALVQAWATRAATAADPFERLATCGIESQRNDQVDILNALARRIAREQGWVTGPDTSYQTRAGEALYAVGDQVVITRNIRRRDGTTLANGTRGIVAATDPDGLRILTRDEAGENRHDRLTVTQTVRNARHGYAMTTHKLQGQTLASLVVDVGPDRDLSATYVAFTRHRDDVLAVVNIADIATGPEIERLIAAGPDARRDAVIAMTANRIRQRGFADSPTAHESIGRSLARAAEAVTPDVTPDAYGHDLGLE